MPVERHNTKEWVKGIRHLSAFLASYMMVQLSQKLKVAKSFWKPKLRFSGKDIYCKVWGQL